MFSIADGEILGGELKPNKLRLVQAWIEIHREDLMADWLLALETDLPAPLDWTCIVFQAPLAAIPPTELFSVPFPVGEYRLFFGVDDNADLVPDATWCDAVSVSVAP